MTMIKHSVVLLVALSCCTGAAICTGAAMPESLEVSIDRKAIAAGEPITGTARIINRGDKGADWIVEVYLYSDDPRASVPRRFTRDIAVRGGEDTSVQFSLPTKWLTRPGSYEFRTVVLDREYNVVSETASTLSLEVALQPMDLEVLVCRDPECEVRAMMFTSGETAYVNYRLDVEGATVTATLDPPDGEATPVALPGAVPLKAAGDYELTVTVSEEGYTKATQRVLFGVREASEATEQTTEQGRDG